MEEKGGEKPRPSLLAPGVQNLHVYKPLATIRHSPLLYSGDNIEEKVY